MLETHQSLQEKYEKEITEVALSKLELTMKLVELRKQFRNNVDNEYKLRCEMMEKQIIKLWKDKDVLEKELQGCKQVEDLLGVLQSKNGSNSPKHSDNINTNNTIDNKDDDKDDKGDDVPLLQDPPKRQESLKEIATPREENDVEEGGTIDAPPNEKKEEENEENETNSMKEEAEEESKEEENNENEGGEAEEQKEENGDNSTEDPPAES